MTVVRDGTWNISCQVPVIQIPWRNRYVIITEVYLVPPGCFASATCLGPSRLRELPEYVALEHRNNVVGWFPTFACYTELGDCACLALLWIPSPVAQYWAPRYWDTYVAVSIFKHANIDE